VRLGVSCTYEERGWTFVSQAGRPVSTRRVSPDPNSTSAQRGLLKTELELQTDGAFWDVYLPQEDPSLDGCIGGVTAAPWIPTIRAMAEEGGYLRVALQACAFVGLGWIRDDFALVQHGAGLYTQALRRINEALQDPVEALSDAALGCCRVLSLFEMYRRSSSLPFSDKTQIYDWQSHVDGSCRLIEMRGFQRHTSGHGLALYDGVRMTAVISALTRRKPNIVTKSEWTAPGPQSPRDKLYRKAGAIASLLYRMDRLTEALADPTKHQEYLFGPVREVLLQTISAGEALRAWERDALLLSDRPRDDPNEERGLDVDLATVDDQRLLGCCKSHGYGFFFLCTEYWAICTRTYHHARQFRQRSAEVYDDVVVPELPIWMQPEPYAVKIATVAPHYFRPEAGLWGAQSAIFPISSALSYFAQTGRINTEPCRMMFASFAQNKAGTVMLDFLRSIRAAGDRNRR
jgi:hypothetical protein